MPNAKPSGSGRVDKMKPGPSKSGARQSKGPSLPTGRAPWSRTTAQSSWGSHLQGGGKSKGSSKKGAGDF